MEEKTHQMFKLDIIFILGGSKIATYKEFNLDLTKKIILNICLIYSCINNLKEINLHNYILKVLGEKKSRNGKHF